MFVTDFGVHILYSESFLSLEESDNEKAEGILEQCDEMFYESEEEINRILEEYAAKIEL